MENRRKPAPPAATLDINCDCKEYVLDYLAKSFPVRLMACSPTKTAILARGRCFDETAQPVLNREACRPRCHDRAACALPPIPTALDADCRAFRESMRLPR
jgi:hypothetical protein